MIQIAKLFWNKHLPKESLRERFVKGTFWVLIGTGLQRIFGLVAAVAVARDLGKVGFGQLSIIQNTIGMLGVFAGIGLSLTAVKHVAEFRSTEPDRANNIIGLSWLTALISAFLMIIVVFAASSYISNVILKTSELTYLLRVASVMILFNTLMGVQRGVLSGLEAFRTVAVTALIQGTLQVFIVIIGTKFYQINGAIWGYTISGFLGWGVSILFVKKELTKANLRIKFANCKKELPILWRFSLPALVAASMVSPVLWAANVIIVNTSEGFAEVGIFNAAARFQQIVVFMGFILSSSLIPILSSKEGMQSQSLQRGNIIISWLGGFYLALFLIFFPEIFGIFGKDFSTPYARMVLVFVMFYTSISNYWQGLARVLVTQNLLWWSLLNSIIWAFVLLISVWFFRDKGAIALAVSMTAAYAIATITIMPLFTKRGLVPKGTIFSKYAFMLWGMLILAGIVYLSGSSLTLRIVFFPLAVFMAGAFFKAILIPGKPFLKI